MNPSVRPYAADDWESVCRIHDAARMLELGDAAIWRPTPDEAAVPWNGPIPGDDSAGREYVGREAFLPLEETYENEGLFDGEVRVAELEGAVVGFIAAFIGDEGSEITWLYVDPALHRRGIARMLVDHVRSVSPGPVELEVVEGNDARAFYERLGFAVEATTTGRLAGNEQFRAVGHSMVWRAPKRA